MKIGILQTGHSAAPLIPEFGDYDAMFRRLLAAPGNEFTTWSVIDDIFPEGPGDADAWVITGSRCGVYDGDAWISRAEDFLRATAGDGVPMLGICFGHQLVAQAFGGTVRKFDGGWNCGLHTYDFEDLAAPRRLIAWHQDQVIEPPADAEIIATSPRCRYAAMRLGPRILTVQPHPEFTGDYARALADARREAIGDDNADAALASLAGETRPDDMAAWLLDFLHSTHAATA